MPFTGQVRKDSTHGGMPFSFFQLGSYRIRSGISGSHRLPKKIGCRFLWKSCACTLSVIAIGYIVSQTVGFVKGKCEICEEEK